MAGDAPVMLGRLAAELSELEAWNADRLEAAARGFAEREHLKLGAVAQPLRAAITGAHASPGLFAVMVALGRDETLARIADLARSG